MSSLWVGCDVVSVGVWIAAVLPAWIALSSLAGRPDCPPKSIEDVFVTLTYDLDVMCSPFVVVALLCRT